MATCFAIYHCGMSFIGWHQPCPCFGNITDMIHITPVMANLIVKCFLIYLLAGSYLTSFFIWRQKRHIF
jgi:hypothetical protein